MSAHLLSVVIRCLGMQNQVRFSVLSLTVGQVETGTGVVIAGGVSEARRTQKNGS